MFFLLYSFYTLLLSRNTAKWSKKSPYCFHSKGEFSYRGTTLLHLCLAAPASSGCSPCQIHMCLTFRITAWHFNARQPVTAYLPIRFRLLSGFRFLPGVRCEAPRRIRIRFLRAPLSSRLLSVRVSRILLVLFQAFCVCFCLTVILAYPAAFVKPVWQNRPGSLSHFPFIVRAFLPEALLVLLGKCADNLLRQFHLNTQLFLCQKSRFL